MNNKFKKAFSVLLEAELERNAPITDEEAMQTTLDDGSTPSDFDVDTNPDSIGQDDSADTALKASQDLMNVVSSQNQKMMDTLDMWIQKIDEFVDFLNGQNSSSIQVRLAKSIPDTIFDKIRVAEAKKISRSAVDLAALAETFRSYKISANDPKYKFS